jgi:thymidylate synthase ThyX
MLNPARNPYRRETLNVGVHAPMMRALDHLHFTFAKKISHTADSQDQRHRMVPGSRPLLTLTDTRSPDYIEPMLIRENPRAREIYGRAMEEAWAAKNELLDRGVPHEFALYLLPNAKAIRLVESGSLLHLLHKWTMRTWRKCSRCARRFPRWAATLGRLAICARGSRLRFAPKARISAG